jgi:hypothetical protein
MGASIARSVEVSIHETGREQNIQLTLALHTSSVDTGAAYHDVVDDGETALAADPITSAIFQATIRQDCRLVKAHSTAVVRFGQRKLLRVEKVPY